MGWMRSGADRDTTRDLRRPPARSMVPYVTVLTNVLTKLLGLHSARLNLMARFVLCSVQLTTTNLRRIAVALKADVLKRSNYRRICHFLVDYEVDNGALSRLLVRLATEGGGKDGPALLAKMYARSLSVDFPIIWTSQT